MEEGTELTWGMKGEMPFLTRFMASDMEEQMGPMQERGLELFDENLQRKLKVHTIEGQGIRVDDHAQTRARSFITMPGRPLPLRKVCAARTSGAERYLGVRKAIYAAN